MSDTDLLFMPAVKAAALIRAKKLSPVDYLDTVLKAIERVQPKLNCFRVVMAEQARRDARKAEEAVTRVLLDLPQVEVATDEEEVRHFIHRHALFGVGIGYVDAHLLAAIRLTAAATLWTRDKRLHVVAERLGLAMA
jgi:Asp-tRNA(Asn)/Glu-tRNA(Gln) amidotransferase A subunit family amidase